jgi:hypothetical protein
VVNRIEKQFSGEGCDTVTGETCILASLNVNHLEQATILPFPLLWPGLCQYWTTDKHFRKSCWAASCLAYVQFSWASHNPLSTTFTLVNSEDKGAPLYWWNHQTNDNDRHSEIHCHWGDNIQGPNSELMGLEKAKAKEPDTNLGQIHTVGCLCIKIIKILL